ncbi:hypothetical protein LIN78_11985 [Leeia sp. TBRC 13508]|uniref:Uncharacterized protein n=1 Tax=Leeia speluncae TaxID=2884804 RepID=A0ABS8D7U8_9NEIS|nr:hypothetical protein [Leeia speluncae]MCB6184264.1 hypothetical protein [Leeia speluncae]
MAADDHYYRRQRMRWAGRTAKRLHGKDGSAKTCLDAIKDLLLATKRLQEAIEKERREKVNE